MALTNNQDAKSYSSSRPLTIGLISPYALVSGGIQNHILDLKKELIKLGHQVYLFAPRLDDEKPHDKTTFLLGKAVLVYVEGTSATPGVWPEDKRKVKKILNSIPFDILHFHSPLTSPTSWQILSYAKTAITITFHESRERIYPWHKLVKIPAALFCNKAHKVIAVSKACAKTVAEFIDTQFTIIPNGIYTSRFSPKGKLHSWYDKKAINLLFLGRLEHRKGIFELLDAYLSVKNHLPQTKLVIAGQGLLEEQIRLKIKMMKMKDVLLTGFAPEDEKPIYYRSCDIFCAPATHDESFGIVLLEAMASGRPIVASANKGYKEMLAGQKEGILVQSKDTRAFAKAIISLGKNERKRQQMSQYGLMKAQKYDWQKITPLIIEVYQQAIHIHQSEKKLKNSENSFFANLWNQITEGLEKMEW